MSENQYCVLKSIKTIRKSCADDFDNSVNNALNNGYILKKRYLDLKGNFVAEMEFYDSFMIEWGGCKAVNE